MGVWKKEKLPKEREKEKKTSEKNKQGYYTIIVV